MQVLTPGVTYFNNHHVYFENQDGITDNTGAGDVKASFEALKGAISAGVLEAEIINREPSFSYFENQHRAGLCYSRLGKNNDKSRAFEKLVEK